MDQRPQEHVPVSEGRYTRLSTVLSFIGLVLIAFAVTGWLLLTLLYFRNQHGPQKSIIPSQFVEYGLGSGGGPGCLTADNETGGLSVVLGPRDQTIRVESLHHVNAVNPNDCNTTESWSGYVDQKATSWLSISPAKGVLVRKRPQAVSILIRSEVLTIGQYQGFVYFKTPQDEIRIEVRLIVVSDALKNTVAYTPVSDLAIAGSVPQLVNGHSVNITISLASYSLLSHSIPSSSRQFSHVEGTTIEKYTSNTENETVSADTFLKDPGYSEYGHLSFVSLAVQLYGNAFSISPSIPPTQPGEQNIVTFSWNILPKEAGPQIFGIGVAALFRPQQGGELQPFYFLVGQFGVNVSDTPVPFFTFGQVTLSSIIVACVGAAFSLLPYVLERVKKSEKKSPAATPPIVERVATTPPKQHQPRQHQPKQKKRGQ